MDFTNLTIGQHVFVLFSNNILQTTVSKITGLRVQRADTEKTVITETYDVVMTIPHYYGPSEEIEDQLCLDVKATRTYDLHASRAECELSGATDFWRFGLSKDEIIAQL